MKIYISGLITLAKSLEDAYSYFESRGELFRSFGYFVLSPIVAEDREAMGKNKDGTKLSQNIGHAIYERDKWMIRQADVVYCNLIGAPAASIGCIVEMAWAALLDKHVILVMENNNPHQHAFIRECADLIFDNEESAFTYLKGLVKG